MASKILSSDTGRNMDLPIPDDVFSFFAANPIHPDLSLAHEATDSTSRIYGLLNAFLDEIPSADVEATCQDGTFRFFAEGSQDIERAARVWIAERIIGCEIPRRKAAVIRADILERRPRPYGLEAVKDIEVDDDHLVPLSEFECDGSRLIRNGWAFLLLATSGAPNSTYWLLHALQAEGLAERTRVRLDPFLWGPERTFPAMNYRMWIYGRQLNWERLASLKEPEYGQWRPGTSIRSGEFTDFVWAPRDGKVHFVCEEVPTLSDEECEVSRYFHGIYSVASSSFDHFDGAVRIYTSEELAKRQHTHVRHTTKWGLREKIFRVEGKIPRDMFSTITQTFFFFF